MRVPAGQQTLLRIFIGESDRHDGRPLYKALVEYLREQKIAGATVVRGMLGYGARSHLHSGSLLRLSQDLPIIVEVVDRPENIERVLPEVAAMVADGLVTLETVRVVDHTATPPSGSA